MTKGNSAHMYAFQEGQPAAPVWPYLCRHHLLANLEEGSLPVFGKVGDCLQGGLGLCGNRLKLIGKTWQRVEEIKHVPSATCQLALCVQARCGCVW